MKYLLAEWGKIKKNLTGRNIFLFLDYDGTLANIADHPDQAVLSAEIRNILKKVARNPRFKIAVISGRRLKDIKSRVGIREIIYSGNHGLEIQGPQFKYENKTAASYKIMLGKIKKELVQALSGFKDVFIEDKKFSLSIHYRLAEKKTIPAIRKLFHHAIKRYQAENKIKARSGKMVFEIVPQVNWNKGYAVAWILDRPEFTKDNYYPAYFGDDTTDEDAFDVLKDKGLTVMVGHRKESLAKYYLNDVTEVGKFADQL